MGMVTVRSRSSDRVKVTVTSFSLVSVVFASSDSSTL